MGTWQLAIQPYFYLCPDDKNIEGQIMGGDDEGWEWTVFEENIPEPVIGGICERLSQAMAEVERYAV